MKKFIFTILTFLFSVGPIIAQWSSAGEGTGIPSDKSSENTHKTLIGFYKFGGSLSLNTVSGNYFNEIGKGKTTGLISLGQLGFFIDRSKHLYLGFGWDIPFKGWIEEMEVNSQKVSSSYTTMGYRFPLFVGYRFNITEKIKIYTQTGINLDLDFAGYWGSIKSGDKKEKIDSELLKDKFTIFNSSWSIGAGITFGKLYIGVDYALPFTDIFNHEYVEDEITGKLGAFNVNLGIIFDINGGSAQKATFGNVLLGQ